MRTDKYEMGISAFSTAISNITPAKIRPESYFTLLALFLTGKDCAAKLYLMARHGRLRQSHGSAPQPGIRLCPSTHSLTDRISSGWVWVFFLAMVLAVQAHADERVLIPGGPLQMGSMDGEPNERPVHTVYLDAFYMDRYLVTNADYARFLNLFGNREEGGKKWLDIDHHPLSWWLCKIQKKDGRFVPKRGYENHPVVKVSWYGARAYARWVGKRLPTEAEWEKAARGGLEGRKYVYGDTLSPDQANVEGLHSGMPVGAYPPNRFGLYDMVASVWQWCSDWYDPEYYARSPSRNPQGPESGSFKVLRGGSWFHKGSWPVATRSRDDLLSHDFCFVTGFRCVRDAD